MKYLLLLVACFSLNQIIAQEGYNITGKILDSKGKGIDLAMVSILNQVDSSHVKSEFTDTDGSFVINGVIQGNYFLKGALIGYKDNIIEVIIDQNMTLDALVLETNAYALDAVTVKAKVPFIQRQIDRTVITPDALISNAGSNALEVLERAPGLTISNDGNIIFKGRSGVAVFINDKPSYMAGSELENYLRSLPAGSIKSIELMENPPAKYEAAGNAGVINIIIKRNRLKGIYGNASVSYRKSRYNGSNNNFNLNYNKNKISMFLNLYTGFWQNFQDLYINRYYKDNLGLRTSAFAQNSFNGRQGQYLNGRTGFDFYPNNKTSMGVSFKRSTSPSERDTDNTSLVTNNQGSLMQRVVADNIDQSTFNNTLVNAYYTRQLDTLGSKITADADYVTYGTTNDQTFKNFVYDQEDNLSYKDEINGDIPSSIEIIAGKIDYTKPLSNGHKFEAGIKSALTKTDNEANYTNTVDGITAPDYNLSNKFVYNEWISAAYVNYNTAIGKLQLQTGLRGETTRLTGDQRGNPEKPATKFERSYNSLFPTFYAAIPLDSARHHNINLSYGRRIDRPYFQDLNPFISPLDRFTFYSGNPNLLPTYAHNVSLTHSYKGILSSSFSYSKTVDGINETLEIRDGIYYSRPGNIASSQSYTLSVNGSFQLTPWYSVNSYVELGHLIYDSELYTEQLNSSGTYYYLSTTNSFILGKGWKADISGRYQSDIVSAQLLIKSYGLMNMGVQKSILDGKGSIKLSANDILYTRRGNGIINNLRQTDADWNSTYDSRNIQVTFSLRFGKSTSNKRRYNSSGSDSEQRRVKG